MIRKWKGAALFLAIFVVMDATFGLKMYVGSTNTGVSSPLSAPPVTGGNSVPSGAALTVTGDTENTPYGNVQVSVSFSGKKITNVIVLQVPNANRHDQQVAQSVPPTLLQEVLSSQSASVDTVSGGTYTSNGYLKSVQSAIDKLS